MCGAAASSPASGSALRHAPGAEAERIRVDRANHRRNLDALYGRQEHLVPIAVAHATDALGTGEHVWIGVPPTRLLPRAPLARVNAAGNDKTAQAATVWIGRDRDALRLFAVCAPVAGLVTAAWRRAGGIGECACTWLKRTRPSVSRLRSAAARRVFTSLQTPWSPAAVARVSNQR
jgi:hypothetical protein